MELLLAYGADPKLNHSHALRWAYSDSNNDGQRQISRLLLRHGADPNDKDPNSDDKWMRMSPFEKAVDKSRLGTIREIAKWMMEISDGNLLQI